MKLLTIILICCTLVFGQAPKGGKKAPTPKQQEVYDPDKLPIQEKACGRLGSTNSVPCQCMKHRVEIRDREQAKCLELADRKARIECASKINPCPVVVDGDNWSKDSEGNYMPKQCSRSCTKARCECCHS